MMSRTAFVALGSFALAVAACGKAADRTDSAAGAAAPTTGATTGAASGAATTTPAGTISLAQIEGMWHGKSMSETSDTALSTWMLDAPPDTSKWVTTFANGLKVPMHIVSVAGDSVVSQMGPYKSPSLKNALVNARVVTRLQGDKMVGTFEARPVAKPDSVRRGRIEATKGM